MARDLVDVVAQAQEQAGLAEDAGVRGRHAHDERDVEHRDDAAAVDHARDGHVLALVAKREDGRQLRDAHVLHEDADEKRGH